MTHDKSLFRSVNKKIQRSEKVTRHVSLVTLTKLKINFVGRNEKELIFCFH